ncbi:tetratricopeptide repeat-containing sensor histidine kinase [Flavobacterium psychrotolerans]|uniref:histidine kinase n=1 Tax=Flavobacterium psychrotolerans TaxID=2169410 RepID=A0A2U1JII3_9FLAO|nr:tetratricopeptide repeat protein [Flavobacterium psychrotolerans]PWA04952.1 two-component sensor histidine kinase [Flavobacterium psychrotolerans]
MKRNRIFFLTLFLVTFFVHAQDANVLIGKLKTELKANPDAKKTALIYSDLTWYYSVVSIDSALHYGGKALLESKKMGDSTLLAQVYSDVGAVYFRKGDFQNSQENYLAAYKIRKARNDSKGLAKINNNLANIYEKKQQYKQAMASFLEALHYFESINDEKNSYTTKGNIGLIFLKLKNFHKALNYISDVVRYQERNNFKEELCGSCLNLGNVYLQINDTINALKYYDKSLKACTSVGNKKGISSGYNNIATIKTEQRKSKDALTLYEKSRQVREQLNSDLDKANFDFNLAKECIVANQLNEAKKILLSTKKVFEKIKSNSKLQVNYKALITVSAKLNQPDSVGFYVDELSLLNEELLGNAAVKQAAELETKFQTEKKEKLLLEKEAETKQKNFLLIGISTLLFLIVIIAFLIHRQQKLKNQQQEQEFQLKTDIGQIEKQNELQEQRLNISRDLHDNIGAQLTFIISSVDNIKYAFDLKNAKLDSKLQSISSFAKSTIVELRDTIWAMNNNEIHFEDLRVRILDFIEKAKMAKENVDFRFTIDNSLSEEKLTSISGMNIYRTIQEAVNNAIKYAEASQILIDVKSVDDKISIHIRDNGIGFDEAVTEKGNGLYNMEKRIKDIEGIFNLVSESGKGTAILLLLNKEK